jgi:hypothetical protein
MCYDTNVGRATFPEAASDRCGRRFREGLPGEFPKSYPLNGYDIE